MTVPQRRVMEAFRANPEEKHEFFSLALKIANSNHLRVNLPIRSTYQKAIFALGLAELLLMDTSASITLTAKGREWLDSNPLKAGPND